MMEAYLQLPAAASIIIAFIFGTAIGSFLNVLIWRLPREQTVQGRSKCPYCKHQLVWHDLVPVLSFLLQRGKCKYCGKPVSFRYPLIEIVTGTLFALGIWLFPIVDFGSLLLFFKVAVVIAICIVVFVIDLEHYLILDKMVYPAIILMLLFAVALDLSSNISGLGSFPHLTQSLIGATVAFIPFWILWYASKGKWMGYGDVKFVVFMGLALGWRNVLVALFASFTIGAIVGLFLMAIGKKQFSSKIPFGTFLSGATILALFWGTQLWDAYWSLLNL